MTYCASYPRYASPFEPRPLFRDFLSQAGFALVSVAFAGAVGACLIYARPGGTVQVGKAPQIAMAPRATPAAKVSASAPRAAAAARSAHSRIQIALRDVMFSLDFPPAPLAQSGPRAAAFEHAAPATQIAKVEAEKVVPAPVPLATDIAENVPLPARRPVELSRPPAASRQVAQATPAPTTPAETSSIFDKLFGTKTEQPKGPALAYANPEDGALRTSPGAASNAVAPAYDKFTAVYDISARTVYLPNGSKLEAHSGL